MSTAPAIDIRPAGRVLQEFLVSPARAKFIQGPVGSGKTTDLIHSLMVNAVHVQRPANGQMGLRAGVRYRRTLVVRNTNKQLIDTVIPSIREQMPEDVWGPITLSGRPKRHIRLPGLDWEWLFYALDKAEDVQDLKSLQLSDAWVSEYRYIPREIVTTLVERTGRFPPEAAGGCTSPQVLGETNAPMEEHWSSIMSGQVTVPEGLSESDKRSLRKPKGWEFFIQPPAALEVRGEGGRVTGYVSNPNAENLANLRPGYYDEALGGKTDDEIRTELLNRPGRQKQGKPVWPAYRDDFHKSPVELEPIEGHPIIVGQDFGRTPATVFAQYVAGRWYLLDELWSDNMGASAYADVLAPFMATRFPGFKFVMFGDPAGEGLSQSDESSPMMMFRAKGLRIIPAPSNDVSVRVNAVDQLLRRVSEEGPAIVFSPRCRLLLQAVGGGYMFRRMQVAGESYSDQPDKGRFSHIADALQYAVIGGGEGRALFTQVDPQHRRMIGHNGGPPMRRPGPPVRLGGRGWNGLDRRR